MSSKIESIPEVVKGQPITADGANREIRAINEMLRRGQSELLAEITGSKAVLFQLDSATDRPGMYNIKFLSGSQVSLTTSGSERITSADVGTSLQPGIGINLTEILDSAAVLDPDADDNIYEGVIRGRCAEGLMVYFRSGGDSVGIGDTRGQQLTMVTDTTKGWELDRFW